MESKYNRILDLDGIKSIGGATGYRIIVSPIDKTVTCWEFILLIPPEMEEPDCQLLVGEICHSVLDEGDMFSAYPLSNQDADAVKNGEPILCFDPDDYESYGWVKPPTHLTH